MRRYTKMLLDLIEGGLISESKVFTELIQFLSEDDIKDFCLNSFGGQGLFNEEENEE